MKTGQIVAMVAALSLGWQIVASAADHDGMQHSGPLVDEVRSATLAFTRVSAAIAAGYGPFLGCVSGPQEGAMGIHYVNADLVDDGELDPRRPEALMYEPVDGRLQFVGVEFIVIAQGWDAHHDAPPTLMGHLLHYTGSPNRYGIPPFYSLHVWAGKDNTRGAFADWNPRVSCAEFQEP